MARLIETVEVYINNVPTIVELIEVTHLRWEVAFKKPIERYYRTDEHSCEEHARRNFQTYIDLGIVAQYRKGGKETKVVRTIDRKFCVYVDGKLTHRYLSDTSIVRYLANAAEDGS